jgi:hypothetical protein
MKWKIETENFVQDDTSFLPRLILGTEQIELKRAVSLLLRGVLCGGRGLRGCLRCGRLLELSDLALLRPRRHSEAGAGAIPSVLEIGAGLRLRSNVLATVDRAWSRRRSLKSLVGLRELGRVAG